MAGMHTSRSIAPLLAACDFAVPSLSKRRFLNFSAVTDIMTLGEKPLCFVLVAQNVYPL